MLCISGDVDGGLRQECERKRIRFMPMPFTIAQLRDEVAAALQ